MTYLYYYLAFYFITTLIVNIYFSYDNKNFKELPIYTTIVNFYINLVKKESNKFLGFIKYISLLIVLPFVQLIMLSGNVILNIQNKEKTTNKTKELENKELKENINHFFKNCFIDSKTKDLYFNILNKNKETLELFNLKSKINFIYIINLYLKSLNETNIDNKIIFNFNNDNFKSLLKENLKISNDKNLKKFILSFEEDTKLLIRQYNKTISFKNFYEGISYKEIFINDDNSFYFIKKS